MKLKIYTDGACSGNPGKGGLKDETEHPFDEERLRSTK